LFKLNNIFQPSAELGHSSIFWGNTLFSLRWTHKYKSNLFGNLTFAYTKYNYQTENNYSATNNEYVYLYNFKTEISNYIIKSNFEWNISKRLSANFGSVHNFYNFIPAQNKFYYKTIENTIDSVYRYENELAFENSLYFQTEYQLKNVISGYVGLRLTDYLLNTKNYFYIEPRALLKIKTTNNSSIKISYAETQQNIHLITSSSASLPMDIWTTSNSDVPPSYSKQITSGFYSTLLQNKLEISVETYYKLSENLVSFKEGATYLSIIGDWTDKLETDGTGKSYGVEFFVEKKQGKTTGWISYTLSKTIRQFDNINFGREFPFKYD